MNDYSQYWNSVLGSDFCPHEAGLAGHSRPEVGRWLRNAEAEAVDQGYSDDPDFWHYEALEDIIDLLQMAP